MNWIVYMITCAVTSKKYIGITKRGLERRWFYHVYFAKNNIQDTHFARAIRAYGEQAFTIEKMYDAVDQIEASIVERGLIAAYGTLSPTGYNLTTGGDNKFEHSTETIEKLRLIHLGKPKTIEARRKLSEWRTGRKDSDATRDKKSAYHTGRKWTPAQRAGRLLAQQRPEYREAMRISGRKGALAMHAKRKAEALNG